VTIFGGLVSATALDAFLTPILLLAFGAKSVERLRSAARTESASADAPASVAPSY
jgi:HME family heavy-metal exporter